MVQSENRGDLVPMVPRKFGRCDVVLIFVPNTVTYKHHMMYINGCVCVVSDCRRYVNKGVCMRSDV